MKESIQEKNPSKGKIKVNILDEGKGLKSIDNVRAVRITSRDYKLLIMEDFTPTLGIVEGDVSILSDEEEYGLKDIKGFYKQQDNVFTILIAQVRD